MEPLLLMALVGQCATGALPPDLVYAVAKAESGGHSFIIRDNTTRSVHRFHSYSSALSFVKSHSRHSLDIGLMQVNTKAHKGNPAHLLSPCGNIRIGSGILEKDLETAEGSLRSTLCLYHRGKRYCGTYPEKVAAFLPRSGKQIRPMAGILPKRSSGIRVHSPGRTPSMENPGRDLADTTTETDSTGSDLTGELDPQLRSADVDEMLERR